MKKNVREVSIIIPCFNVEKYIEKCIKSLISQLNNYNFEIILVDDFSTDNTLEKITSISERFKNIIIINNSKNMGAGVCRNIGVKQAKYDYISFVDADDYVDKNFYDTMFNMVEKENSDIVICDINIIYEDTKIEQLFKSCNKEISKYNIINTPLAASPCNKIIKKKYLIKYPFAENIMNEDIASILSIIVNCDTVSYTTETRYNYIQHQSSVQNSRLSVKRLDVIKAIDLFMKRISKINNYDKYVDAVIFQQLICFIMYVPIKEKNYFKRAHFLHAYCKELKKLNINILKNKEFVFFLQDNSLKSKIYYKTVCELINLGFGYLASLCMSVCRIRTFLKQKHSVIKKNIDLDLLAKYCRKNQELSSDKSISVVIPNYNYENFLLERIFSILSQNYKINELIILDDCSTDNSRKIINEIVEKLSPFMNISKDYNSENSGCVFKQWQRAFELCSSDYLWIAEADDYCNKKMLSSIMKVMRNDEDIKIGYVDTAFINTQGEIILKTIKPEIDIQKSGHWDRSYVSSGIDEIKKYSFLNCTIANVSSVVFKKENYDNEFKKVINYRQVGDYLFYVLVMSHGKISYIDKTYNYYRVHGNNVTSNTKKITHFKELQNVHKIINEKYPFNKEQKQLIEKRYKFLKKNWNLYEE